MSGYIWPDQAGDREQPKRPGAARARVPSPDALADRLVVVMRLP